VARLEQSPRRELTEVHTLGSYVVAVAGSTKQPLGKALVVRFLNVAFNQIAQTDTGLARSNVRDQAAALYFIGRQLTDLFAQYLPDRLERWQRLVSDPGSSATYDHAIDPAELRASSPGDIALNAAEATDRGERDSLYARAALGWLTQGDVKEAQAAALKVADAGTRDRVLTRIARWYSSQKRIDDAAALVRRITDDMLRVEALAMLGAAALASQDRARALELLNEAESCAEKAQPSPQRADLLVKIAGTFAAFDAIRSFEVLQSAVKAINEITGDRNDLDDRSPTTARDEAQSLTIDELYAASFDKTLATLAKTNFDRALILAQQLTQEEASVIAQLAVCRGGLRQTPSSERSANADETESVINH
jgi:tetratricopeptide (TPR) repeat protein